MVALSLREVFAFKSGKWCKNQIFKEIGKWNFIWMVISKELLFVHDRIYSSVADYNSSRVGVGCMYVECMSAVPVPFSWWDNFSKLWAQGLGFFVGPYYVNQL